MTKVAERLTVPGLEPAEPATKRSANVEKYESLARDLVIAYEMGHAAPMQRLQDHFGLTFAWDELRAGVRRELDAIPESEKPPGYFALPQARLLIARRVGFVSWQALSES